MEPHALKHPDLGVPPEGWTVGRLGPALRLVPPGAYLDRSRCQIVISPLLARDERLRSVSELVLQALAAECARTGMTLVGEPDETAVQTTGGLEGVQLDVVVALPSGGRTQRRRYVMYLDASWLYGIHYMADEGTWAYFLPTFDAAARSVQAVPPREG